MTSLRYITDYLTVCVCHHHYTSLFSACFSPLLDIGLFNSMPLSSIFSSMHLTATYFCKVDYVLLRFTKRPILGAYYRNKIVDHTVHYICIKSDLISSCVYRHSTLPKLALHYLCLDSVSIPENVCQIRSLKGLVVR